MFDGLLDRDTVGVLAVFELFKGQAHRNGLGIQFQPCCFPLGLFIRAEPLAPDEFPQGVRIPNVEFSLFIENRVAASPGRNRPITPAFLGFFAPDVDFRLASLYGSDTTQEWAFLVCLFSMAERGGFEPPLGCLFPKTV